MRNGQIVVARYRDLYSRGQKFVAFRDDAMDEHKNGHACRSLIRSNSWTSVDVAKKKKKKKRTADTIWRVESSLAIIIDITLRRIAPTIASVCANHPGDIFFIESFCRGYFDWAIIA